MFYWFFRNSNKKNKCIVYSFRLFWLCQYSYDRISGSDFKASLKNNTLTIKSKESLDGLVIPFTLGADKAGAFFNFVEVMGGVASHQGIIVPTIPSFKLTLTGNPIAPPIEISLRKTFNSLNAEDINVNLSEFSFAIGKGLNEEGRDVDSLLEEYLNFDFDEETRTYTYNGTTASRSADATQLKLDASGNLHIAELPADDKYFIVETAANSAWRGKVGQVIALDNIKDDDGICVFDNTGTGLGLLAFYKAFYTEGGLEVTSDYNGDEAALRAAAIAGLRFNITDVEGNIVPVTGSNGVYECSDPDYIENGGVAEEYALQLDENGRCVVDKLPAGTYYIDEDRTELRSVYMIHDEDIYTSEMSALMQVPSLNLPDTLSIEEKLEKISDTAACQTLCNYFVSKYTNVTIHKDSEDGQLAGHEFTVTSSDGSVSVTGTTDENGELRFTGLPAFAADSMTPLEYTVTETANLKYKPIDPQTQTAFPCANGEDGMLFEFFNFLNTSVLGVVKTADDGNVGGITFDVDGSDGSHYEMTTDSTGYAQIDDLPVYTADGSAKIVYTVTERVPLRYEAQNPQEVVLGENGNDIITYVQFDNITKKSFYILQKWAEDFAVEGLRFAISGSDGTYQEAVSDTNGLVVFENLPVYDKNDANIVYTAYELNTPERYHTPKSIDGIILAELADANRYNYGEIENKSKSGKLTIVKKNDSGEKLSGACFNLYGADDYRERGEAAQIKNAAMSDSNGIAVFDDLGINKEYAVVEVLAPDGYARTAEPYFFTITEENASANYEIGKDWINTTGRTLKVMKTDNDTNAVLAGAVFDLYDGSGKLVDTKMTDKNGIAEFTGLEYKAYRLVEVSAATGYELPENEADRTWNIEATGNDKVIEINVKNTAKHEGRSITVYKTNSDNRPLSGAVFSLYLVSDGTETLISDATTDKNGKAVWDNLEPGKYIAREKQAPTGYTKVDDDITFDVDTTENVPYSAIVPNTPGSTSPEVYVLKKDAKTDEVLKGAEFTLYYDNGKVAAGPKAVGDDGKVAFKEIECGRSYRIFETKAPDGYKQVSESFDFTADNDGHIHFTDTPTFITEMIGAASHTVGGPNKGDILELTWVNSQDFEQKYGDLELVKTSEDNEIKGLVFEAVGGGEKYSGITDDSGKILFKHLPLYDKDGQLITYTVTEKQTGDKYLACPAQETTLKDSEKAALTFRNKLKKSEVGSIRIVKTSEDGKIDGLTFKVIASTGETYTMTTDKAGIAQLDNLPIYVETGTAIAAISYTVMEVPVVGYVELAPVEIGILFKNAVIPVEFHNTPVTINSEVELYKVDESNKPLVGATFSLYADGGCTQFIASEKTAMVGDKAAVKFSEGLSASTTYYLRETEVPSSEYVLNKTVWECKIDSDGNTTYRVYGTDADFSTTVPTCVNTKGTENRTAKIIKTDGTNPLEGATFGLYEDAKCTVKLGQNVSKIDSSTSSDTYGKAVVKFDAEIGKTYYIKEISAPSEQYVIFDTVFVAEVSDTGKIMYGIVGSNARSSTFPECVNKKKSETTVTATTTVTTTPPPSETTTTTTTNIITCVTSSTTTTTGPDEDETTTSTTTSHIEEEVTSSTTTPTDIDEDTTVETSSETTTTTDDTPHDDDTTTTTTTTTTPDDDTPDTPDTPDNPNTGVQLNVMGFTALAVLSGIIFVAALAKGFIARRKERDNY